MSGVSGNRFAFLLNTNRDYFCLIFNWFSTNSMLRPLCRGRAMDQSRQLVRLIRSENVTIFQDRVKLFHCGLKNDTVSSIRLSSRVSLFGVINLRNFIGISIQSRFGFRNPNFTRTASKTDTAQKIQFLKLSRKIESFLRGVGAEGVRKIFGPVNSAHYVNTNHSTNWTRFPVGSEKVRKKLFRRSSF